MLVLASDNTVLLHISAAALFSPPALESVCHLILTADVCQFLRLFLLPAIVGCLYVLTRVKYGCVNAVTAERAQHPYDC